MLYLFWTATNERGKLRKLAQEGSCYKYVNLAFRLRMMKYYPCIPSCHALKFAASQGFERRARHQ
jgi:hypothetical protein